MVEGVELDVDVISDGRDWCVPGILEQLDPPGVHSGDSVAVLPPQALSRARQEAAAEAAGRIALALGVRGILNVQMIAAAERVVVIEANPRASRTVPIVAKATGRDVVAAAVRCALGASLAEVGLATGPGAGCDRWSRSRRRSARSGGCPAWIDGSAPRCGRPARCWAWRPTTPPPWKLRARRRRRTCSPAKWGACRRALTLPSGHEERPSRPRYGGSRTGDGPSARRQANSRAVRRDGPWLSPPARASIGDGPDPVGAGQPIGSPTPSRGPVCSKLRAGSAAGQRRRVPLAAIRCGDRHAASQVAAVPADQAPSDPLQLQDLVDGDADEDAAEARARDGERVEPASARMVAWIKVPTTPAASPNSHGRCQPIQPAATRRASQQTDDLDQAVFGRRAVGDWPA